jgi:transcriptional repressor NrdR
MKCPHCGHPDTRVVDTREAAGSIRRRRECLNCGQRFTTYEHIAHALMVVKSDGRREPWDRTKLANGIRIACAKRPIPSERLEGLVDQIEDKVMSLGRSEVKSEYIGQLVLEGLKELDPVAYIRYGIVYLALPDLHAVRAEIDRLLEGR